MAIENYGNYFLKHKALFKVKLDSEILIIERIDFDIAIGAGALK